MSLCFIVVAHVIFVPDLKSNPGRAAGSPPAFVTHAQNNKKNTNRI